MSRPDFAQKLLNDLKMRKERMASTKSSTNSSVMSADAYGSSRRSLKGSNDMKSLAKVTSNTAKLQRPSSRSQSARMDVEKSNQIVPYGGGHSSKQPLDLSMTLSYALDDNGKLKKMNLTGSSAMIGFLRQISQRSMDFANTNSTSNSRVQWPSNAHFPTLTNLHIDEVSKGAQKLNQILKTFYNGVNSNGCSVDVGKQLLKGTKELEESLRMLVNLQEASDHIVVPQRKSKVRLLEMSEDGDEGNEGKAEEKKRVEKPVFSFDKRATNQGKGQNKVNSHRRSASCGSEVRNSSSSSSSQVNSKPGGMGISNVVAKLMGLEEIPRNGGETNKAGNQLTRSNKELDCVISQRMSFGVSRGSEFGDEDVWSNKIVILTSKETDERKPAWRQTEKEQIMTHIMQMNRKNSEEVREDRDFKSMREQAPVRKENGGIKRALSKDELQKAANMMQGKIISKESGHEKRNISKVSESRVGRDKSVRDGRLQHPKSPQREETQRKNQKLEPRNIMKGQNKAPPPASKIEASEMVIEDPSPKDIHEVKTSSARQSSLSQAKDTKNEKVHRKVVLQETRNPVTFENSVSTKEESLVTVEEVKPQPNESNSLKMEANKQNVAVTPKATHNNKIVKGGPNQKANEVMAKPAKSASRTSRAMKQQTTILQGLKQRQQVNKGSQVNASASRPIESEPVRSKSAATEPVSDISDQYIEIQKTLDKASSYTCDELQFCKEIDNIPHIHSNEDVKLNLPCDQLNQPLTPRIDPEPIPQTTELVQVSDKREIPNHFHREKEAVYKQDIQKPLTNEEIYLKQKLITSQVFLNTAEALFKLNIPLGILNASDITCQEEEDTKQTIDSAYEMLKMKGKRRELIYYPCKNTFISNLKLRSLDDLVRQLHKDFQNLRSYGKTGNTECDQAEYLLKMLERDIHHKDIDVNCMWDMGWNDKVFAYIEMDEVIRDVEKCMLNELLDEVLEGFMEISPLMRNGVTVC